MVFRFFPLYSLGRVVSRSIDGSADKVFTSFSYVFILLEVLLMMDCTPVIAVDSIPPISESSIHVVLYSENNRNMEGYNLATCTHETLSHDTLYEALEESGSILFQKNVVVLIAPIAFKPIAEKWIEYRTSQGYTILALFQESNDDFNNGYPIFLPQEFKTIIKIFSKYISIDSLIIMGDGAPTKEEQKGWRDIIPAPRVPAKVVNVFGSEETIASDGFYTDLDNDGIPEFPIGRLPTKTCSELETCVGKIIRYEQRSHLGIGERKLNVLIGSNGLNLSSINSSDNQIVEQGLSEGMSKYVTLLVSKTVKNLLSNYIPQSFVLSFTQFSRESVFCPELLDSQKVFLERINEETLFVLYMGHGFISELDQVVDDSGRAFSILDVQKCEGLNNYKHPPIMLLFACYVGAYDAWEPSLSEELVLRDGGPIAVIAASRVTAPYGMSVWGLALLDSLFGGNSRNSGQSEIILGKIFNEAQKKAVVFKNSENKSATGDSVKNIRNNTDANRGKFLEWVNKRLISSLETSSQQDIYDFKNSITTLALFLDPTSPALNDQIIDHIAEFNLLGDPLLRIKIPRELEVEEKNIVFGSDSVTIKGKLGIANDIQIKAELVRDGFNTVLSSGRLKQLRETNADYKSVYERANDFVVSSTQCTANDGFFSLTLLLPEGYSGKSRVRIFARDDKQAYIGSFPISIRPSRIIREEADNIYSRDSNDSVLSIGNE